MAQTTIADIRAKYPQYDRLSDQELADKLHAKFYAQMDKADFYGRVGLSESAKPLPSAAGDGADTQGFADPLLEAMRQPIPAPLADSPAAAGPAAGGPPPAVTPPGRVPQPQAMAQPGTRTEAAPSIDQARPPSPPPTPRDLDRILFGMMGGSSPETEAWARREIQRQMAEAQNGQNGQSAPTLAGGPTFERTGRSPQAAPTPRQAAEVDKPGTVLSRTATASGQALRNVPENLLTGWFGMKLAGAELGQEVGATDIIAQMTGAQELATVEDQLAQMQAQMAKSPRDAAQLQEQFLALSQRRNQLRELYGASSEIIAGEIASLERFEKAGAQARTKIGDLETSKVQVDAEPGSPEYYVSAAIASSAEMAPALAASAIMRNPLPAMVFMGGYSGGTSYVEGRKQGLSPHDARGYATLYAAAEGIPEALPVSVLLKPGQKFLTRIISGAAAEGAQEMITEALQIGIDKGYVSPDMTWAEARARIADAGIIGTLAGGTLGTAVGTFDAALNVRNRDRREKDDAAAAPRPARPVAATSAPAQPTAPTADPHLTAMGGQPQPVPAAPPAPVQPAAPAADAAPIPVDKPAERPEDRKSEAEPDEAPQYEIFDEIETVDGEKRPTGRKVRVDLTTGEASVVDATEAAGTAPASAPAATRDQPESQPQSKPEQALVGAQPEPAAGGARSSPQRRFLTHEETLAIETDPQTFQYKGGADTEGVTSALQGVTRFDPNRAGQVVLFETNDGRLIVADGHQRTGLARRMAAAGQEDVGGMAAVIYREADGYTPEEVMRLAAIKNIGEGSGSAVDAARVLRSSAETVEDLGLPPQSALVRTAEGLRRLSDEAFGMVVNGRANERDGAIVGRVVANRDAQIGILGLLARLKPANAFQAESIARQAAAEVTTETQSSLFGDEEVAANLYLERAKILDNAVKRLADEKRLFGTLTERIEAITAAGNVLAKDENARRVDLAARMRDYLASQANLKGPISDALSQAASDLKAGTPVATATGRFLESLQRAMEVGGGRGEAAPGGRGVDKGEGRREEPQRQEVSPPEDDLLAAMGVKPDPATRPEPKPEPAPQDGDDLLAAMGARPARNPETDRRAADETRVRGSQSKIRTGAPQKDAGPLFDTQGDIEKAAARPTGHDLIMRGRAILTPFERDGDEAFDRAAGKDLTGSSRGRALADELAGAASLKERTDIAVRWVTEHGKNTGLEHAVILDADGVPLAIMSGHKTGVSFHSAVWRAGAAGKIAVSVHNHPSSGGPSAGDFAVLALWPKHRMVIAGHNGDRHEITATEAFDKAAMMDDAKPAYSMLPTREELEPVFEAIRVKLNTRAREIAKERSQADGGEAAFHKAMRPAFALAMERAGMIRYTDTAGWLRSMQAEGFDFEAIHGQISGTLADRLGRAGFDVSKVGDRGGDQATGSGADAAPSRTDRTDRKPAQDGEGRDGDGRVQGSDQVATDDFDAALDAVFGAEKKVARRASDIAKDLGDLFGEPDAGFREGEIEAEKYARAIPLFREALAGVDMANTARKDVFVAMIRPLAAAGLKREAVAKMRPYFDQFLDEMKKPTIGFKEPGDGFNAPEDTFAAEIMRELAAVDDLFRYPRSAATSLDGVFADVDPTVKVGGRLAEDDPRAEGKGADTVTMLSTAKDHPFYVFETDSQVWVDVSDLEKGEGGSAIYAAASDYAMNAGKVFVGDPEGLSAAALRRRTDNMLSTALKHGTTRHIAPHEYQVTGDTRLGVPPLRWTEGDDLANLAALIEVSTANLISHIPEVADARYDFATGTFRSGEGQPLTDGDLDKWASAAAGNRKARVGRATLKRGILLNTLARAESGERPGLLERVLRQPRHLVERGLKDTFYQADKARAPDLEDLLRIDENGNSKEEPSPLSREEIRKVMPKLRAELDRLDLKRVRLWQDTTGADWQGAFLTTPERGMEVIIGASLDPMKTLYHEVIHIMRSMNLFTTEEWRALEIMAARKWVEEFDIAARYQNLLPSEQIEEAIAEAFAEAITTRKAPSGALIVRALNKVVRLLRAIRNAFNGAGFNTVEDVFGKVIAGELTRRNAGNTGAAATFQEDGKRQALPDDLRLWRDALRRFLEKKIAPNADLRVGRVPPVLRALHVPSGNMVMRASKVRTVIQEHSDLPNETLRDLPNLIADPEMIVLQSGKESDALILTSAKTKDGRPVAVAIKAEGSTNKGQAATIVMTVYPLDDATTKVQRYARSGDILYLADERSVAEYELTGANSLRGPRAGLSGGAAPKKVLRRADVFKGGPGFEASTPRFQAARVPSKTKDATFSPDAVAKIKAMNAIYGPPQEPQQLPTPPAFSVPERRFMTRFREEVQDRFIMFESVNAAIAAETGAAVPEHVDFRLRQTVYDGRTAARLERLLTEEVKAISTAMKDAKLTLDDVGTYLIAKHARERNAVMAQRDPERFTNGNGSGLYDEAADALLTEFEEKGMTARLERVAKLVRAMLARDLDLREKAGLVTRQEAESWRSMYENYTPLRGAAERDEGGQIGRLGRGFDIRGKEVKTALGRMSVADNPLVQAIAMRQEGIVRAEKNRAMQALLFEVQKFPNPDLWEVLGKLPTRKMLDPDTGMVRNIVDFGALREDEIIGVKIGGETHYIRIKDGLMVEAVKNLHQTRISMWTRFVNAVSRITRTFSRFQTGANPNFVFPNAEADFLEGVWTAYNADKKKMVRGYVKNYPLALAAAMQREVKDSALGRGLSKLPIKTIRRLFGEDVPPEQLAKIEKYIDEWELSGGRISFMAFRDIDEITRDINAEIEAEGFRRWVTKPWTAIGDMVEVIEKVNQPVESAGRLAMYITARENGYSKDKAAAMSLDASGNYYRRGRMTRGFSAFYAFANPAVQGIEKFVRFSKKPRNIAIMGGVVATGYALTMMNMLLWGDDDDPEGRPLYMQVPEFERSRSIIIPYGIEEDESVVKGEPGRKRLKYFMFRIPHNLRFLMTMGNELAMVHLGHREPAEATSAVTSSFLMNSNPFGADTVWNMAAPTAIDPFVDITLNRTWTGAPIRPDEERWNEGVPRSSQVFERSTSETSRWVAQGLNRLGGGDRFTQAPVLPEVFDRYPGEIDYLFNYWTGGLGRFVKQSGEMVLDASQGIESDPGRVPIMRSVFGRTNQYPAQERYYDLRTEMNEDKNRARFMYKTLEKNPDDKEAAAAWARISAEMNIGVSKSGEFVWEESVSKPFDDADDKLKEKREALLDNQNDETLTRKERVEKERQIKLEIEEIQREAIKDYLGKRAQFLAAIGPE